MHMVYRTSLAGLSLVCATAFVTPISAQPVATKCDLPQLVRGYTLNNVPTAVLTKRINDVHNLFLETLDPMTKSLLVPSFLPTDAKENTRLTAKGNAVVNNALSALDDFLGDVAATQNAGCSYCKLAPVYNIFFQAQYPNAIQADVQLLANAPQSLQNYLSDLAFVIAKSAKDGIPYSQADTFFRTHLQLSPDKDGVDADGRYNGDFLTYYGNIKTSDPDNIAFYANMKNTPPLGNFNSCAADQTTKFYWMPPSPN
jgi:hypothetical protein